MEVRGHRKWSLDRAEGWVAGTAGAAERPRPVYPAVAQDLPPLLSRVGTLPHSAPR